MRFDWIREAITDPEKNVLATIVVTTFGLGIVSNGASSLLLETVGNWVEAHSPVSKLTFQIGALVGLMGLILVGVYLTNLVGGVKRFLGTGQVDAGEANVVPLTIGMPGLVVAVSWRPAGSTQVTPAELAIRHHLAAGTLRHCWLICTEKSLAEAEQLVQKLVDEGVRRSMFYYGADWALGVADEMGVPLTMVLAAGREDDPNYVRQVMEGIYGAAWQRFGLGEEEMIVDYTGGTKSITAGMMLACVSPGRRLQYFSQIEGRLMMVRTAYRLRRQKG
jgi:hypothetical protein